VDGLLEGQQVGIRRAMVEQSGRCRPLAMATGAIICMSLARWDEFRKADELCVTSGGPPVPMQPTDG
jgi:hypothetical protein